MNDEPRTIKNITEHQMIDLTRRMRKRAETAEAALKEILEDAPSVGMGPENHCVYCEAKTIAMKALGLDSYEWEPSGKRT